MFRLAPEIPGIQSSYLNRLIQPLQKPLVLIVLTRCASIIFSAESQQGVNHRQQYLMQGPENPSVLRAVRRFGKLEAKVTLASRS